MSYTNETTYYGLPLPTGSDKSTFTDNNTAFQAVDAALHTAYEQSGAATEDIVAIKATVANLIQADIDFQNDLDTEKGKIRNLQDKEVLQDTEIAAVKADAFDMITAYNEPTATSTHAYSVGDFFIYNDVLYIATESIAIGDTIVPDTNCSTTNITTELKDIKKDLVEENVDTSFTWSATGYQRTCFRVGKLIHLFVYAYGVTNFDGTILSLDNVKDKPASNCKGTMLATYSGTDTFGFCQIDANSGDLVQQIGSTPSNITKFVADIIYYTE